MNLPIADKIEKEINFMSIEHKEITDTDLHGISIRNSVISECLLKNVDLHNSDLLGTKIYKTVYQNVNYRNADIFSLWFSKCKFINIDFTGAGIEDVSFIDCIFENCILDHVGLKNCRFERTCIIGLSPTSSTFSLNTYSKCTITKCKFKGSFVYQIFDACEFENVEMDISLLKYNHGIGDIKQISFISDEEERVTEFSGIVNECLNHNLFLNAMFVSFNFESYINPEVALESVNALNKMLQYDILLQENELQHFKNLFHYFYYKKSIAPIVLYKMFDQIKQVYLNPIENVAYNKSRNLLYQIGNSLYMDFSEFCDKLKDDIYKLPSHLLPIYAWIHYENEPQISLCSILNTEELKLFDRVDCGKGSFWEYIQIGEGGLEILKIFIQLLGISVPIIYSEIKEKRKNQLPQKIEKKALDIQVSIEPSELDATKLIQSTCKLLDKSDLFVSDMHGYNNKNIKEIKIEYRTETISYK